MSKRLYIIGNGFDLHHGIASNYRDFGDYLERVDPDTYAQVERYFGVDETFWSTFEERLADFDTDTVTEDADEFLAGYGDEDWSDSGHHDYQYEIGRVVEAISVTMRARFADWIRSLAIPDAFGIGDLRLHLDVGARFLNFNYTKSLPRIYGVPDANVLHVHGSADDPDAALVLGHGRDPGVLDPYRFERFPEDADMRVVEGQSLIDEYFRDTFKPTDVVLARHAQFFAGLGNIERIIVLGHSLSDVDLSYFEAVIANTRPDVQWAVSWFDSDEVARRVTGGLGISPDRAEFFTLADVAESGTRGLI